MNKDILLIPIILAVPFVGFSMVRQTNPWQTLVLRCTLGNLAALIYALLGAVDVAVTEALVGTLLSTVLYAVAIRATCTFRLLSSSQAPLSTGRQQELKALIEPLGWQLKIIPDQLNPSLANPDQRSNLNPMDIHAQQLPDGRLQLRHPSLLKQLVSINPEFAQEMGMHLDPARTEGLGLEAQQE
ncbi:MAG: hydrogenase subunit MbhD domain-containing protein [Prochlorococcus sp.]|nr:hydrogenase subunit MbhD domain-containing protein [Prochlorococcaceae cyanobacterium Fu_MAG_50]